MAGQTDKAATRPRLGIQLFGPLSVTVGDTRLGPRDFGGVKPKQIFEVLLSARGRSVSKDRLADLLWGESLPQNVSGTLETYVSVLRRRIEANKGRSASVLVTEPGAYRLETDLVEIDVDRFDELVHRASQNEDQVARRLLEQALILVRGEILEDEPYAEWVEPLRNQYRQAVTQTLLEAADLALSEHDHHAALAHSQHAVEVDPLNERAYRAIMMASYSLGRQRDALEAYDRCERMLTEELGVEPLEKTRSLHAAIRSHADADSLLPQRRSASRTTDSQGLGSTSLVGRGAELKQVGEIVERSLSGRFSLTLIEGVTGSGKTRLLEEVANRLPLVQVVRARCCELEDQIPYAALASMLNRNLAEFYGPDSDDADVQNFDDFRLSDRKQATLLDDLIERAAYNAPFVILIDDIQWADAASIATLGYAQKRCAELPIAVVATVRTDAVQAGRALRQLRPTARVQLGPLAATEVTGDLWTDLFERTGGHAGYATAYLGFESDLPQEPPAEVRDSILARATTDARRYKLLQVASVLDEPFTPDDVARLADCRATDAAEELEVLCREELLRCVGDSFTFFGSDIKQVLLETLSVPRRRLLERKAALVPTSPAPTHRGRAVQLVR